MDQTLEVRWFYDGPPPASVRDWIAAFDPDEPSEREDLYLISDDPSLNVKLREGKVQLKRRSGARPLVAFADAVRGYREFWQKWSFPLTDDAPNLFTDDPSGLWLPVTKTRRQRTFTPDAQRALLDTLDEPDPAEASVELTRVTHSDHVAWTVCMEAEGRAEALAGTLRQMGRYVFGQGTPPELAPEHSTGYVGWLERVHDDLPAAPVD